MNSVTTLMTPHNTEGFRNGSLQSGPFLDFLTSAASRLEAPCTVLLLVPHVALERCDLGSHRC
jgi:hypothetical protein